MTDEGIRLWVWRAWDREWVAECSACDEVHWGGRWMDAMVAAWGHLAMSHPRPPLRLVIPEIPEPAIGLMKWQPDWRVWNA